MRQDVRSVVSFGVIFPGGDFGLFVAGSTRWLRGQMRTVWTFVTGQETYALTREIMARVGVPVAVLVRAGAGVRFLHQSCKALSYLR